MARKVCSKVAIPTKMPISQLLDRIPPLPPAKVEILSFGEIDPVAIGCIGWEAGLDVRSLQGSLQSRCNPIDAVAPVFGCVQENRVSITCKDREKRIAIINLRAQVKSIA